MVEVRVKSDQKMFLFPSANFVTHLHFILALHAHLVLGNTAGVSDKYEITTVSLNK